MFNFTPESSSLALAIPLTILTWKLLSPRADSRRHRSANLTAACFARFTRKAMASTSSTLTLEPVISPFGEEQPGLRLRTNHATFRDGPCFIGYEATARYLRSRFA